MSIFAKDTYVLFFCKIFKLSQSKYSQFIVSTYTYVHLQLNILISILGIVLLNFIIVLNSSEWLVDFKKLHKDNFLKLILKDGYLYGYVMPSLQKE